jgi:hypothetical protein
MAKLLKKRSISLPLVLYGCISSLVLALSMTPTLGAFSASISGDANSAGTGTIVMQETDSSGTITCLSTDGGGLAVNAASCSAMNRYGGDMGMRPGDSVGIVTYIRNIGTIAASSFSLTPGVCVQSATGTLSGSATDFCSKIAVSITSDAATIFSGTAETLGAAGTIDVLSRLGLARVEPGLQITFTVTTTMDPTVDNSYQGLKVSQPMTWTFSA